MGDSKENTVEFIGGPLDGPNWFDGLLEKLNYPINVHLPHTRGVKACYTLQSREPYKYKFVDYISVVSLPCVNCGAVHTFKEDSPEANDVFNVFCPGGDCEDEYAASN